MKIRAIACVAALALAACGGGGDPSPVLVTGHASAANASVAFRIVVPAVAGSSSQKHRAYVSSATASATFAVNSGPTVTANCTNVCSGTVDAPVGSDTFSVKLYDAPNGTGHILSIGATTQTIVANTANAVNVTFDGVLATLSVSIPTVTPGMAGSVAVSVRGLDPDGNVIVGPGNYVDANDSPTPITVSNSDTSGNSSLSTTTVAAPGAAVSLNYTAAFDTLPSISVTSGALSARASVVFPPPAITGLSAFAGISNAPVNETVTGTNFVAGGTSLSFDGSGNVVGSINVVNSTTLTVSITPGSTFGVQHLTVTTPIATSADSQPFATATSSYPVTRTDDTVPGSPAGTGTGAAGDLRYAIRNAPSGALISFPSSCTVSSPCTIALAGPLYPILNNAIVNGGTYGAVKIDGGGTNRAFWIGSLSANPTVILDRLLIQNALAQGGNGASGQFPGGGGAGLGAGVFVESGSLTLVSDELLDDAVRGGSGGNGTGGPAQGGGGGGLGGNGSVPPNSDGGGGGGLLESASGTVGGTGFYGCTPPSNEGCGGVGSMGAAAGNGSFGASGGATDGIDTAGSSGFGAGGAGQGIIGSGESGGPGGGAGFVLGPVEPTPQSLGTISGGAASINVAAGGGAAAGPALFLYCCELTSVDSDASGSLSTGGAGGASFGSDRGGTGGADATPVYVYGGTVYVYTGTFFSGNTYLPGSGGPVASALGSGTP